MKEIFDRASRPASPAALVSHDRVPPPYDRVLPSRRAVLRAAGVLGAGAALSAVGSAWGQSTGAGQSPAGAPSPAEWLARLRDTRPAGFPSQPIEMVVAYPPGGGMDASARVLARYVEKVADAKIVVANRAGAAGVIGEAYMATQARPDGYTVGLMASNMWSNSMLRAEGKWSYRDVEPIAFANSDPPAWVIAAEGRLRGKTLREIVAMARETPGSVRVAASSSTATAFIVEQIEAATGARFVPVLYQGDRQALTDLLGGHIDVSYGYQATFRPQVEAGKLAVIGVASVDRMPSMPQVPTFNESIGSSDIVWDAFRFVVVPRGVPADRKAWLEAAFNAALADPGLAAEFAALGATVDRRLSSAALVAAEVERRATLERTYLTKTGRLK